MRLPEGSDGLGEAGGWRRERGTALDVEVHGSGSPSPRAAPTGASAAAFLGLGYLVAVGYMDPGNWATSLAGGSQFGYALLFVALLSNIMAIILQALCARLASPRGAISRQACRDAFRRRSPVVLWILGRDRHLRHRPRRGDRHRDRPQPALRHPARDRRHHHRARRFPDPLAAEPRLPLGRGAASSPCSASSPLCFGVQIAMADPDWGQVIRGFAPTTEIVTNPEMLYLALGIIGAHGDAA